MFALVRFVPHMSNRDGGVVFGGWQSTVVGDGTRLMTISLSMFNGNVSDMAALHDFAKRVIDNSTNFDAEIIGVSVLDEI